MIRSLRWFPMPSLGSFVADDNGTILVAPMNANGTRSTYEGETVEVGADSRETEADVLEATKRYLLVGKLADGFRSVLRSWLTESQLVEVDRRNRAEKNDNICHSHDFCDSNMAMYEAFFSVVGRAMALESGQQGDDDNALFNDAWTQAKADGFAVSAPTDDDLEQLQQIAANADLGIADERAGDWLRRFVDRLRAVPVPGPFDPASDADRPK